MKKGMMMKMTKMRLGVVCLAAAIAFNAQAGWFLWAHTPPKNVTVDANAIAYLVLDDAGWTVKKAINDAMLAGEFDPSNFSQFILHTQTTGMDGSLPYGTYVHLDIPGTSGATTTEHNIFLLLLNPDASDGYDSYYAQRPSFLPQPHVYGDGHVFGDFTGASVQYVGANDGTGWDFGPTSVTLIPEPTTALLALAGVATLLLRRRRRE